MCMLPLFALLQQMAEPIPFLPLFLPTPEIYSFWGISSAITPYETQKVLPTPTGRKYSTESSLLTFVSSMTQIYLLFFIDPPLTFLLHPPLLPFPERCFRTWVMITYQFFYLSLSLWSFAPTSIPLPLAFRKLAGMTLPPTLTFTVLLQRNTRLFLFSLLLLSLTLWH